jgi:hypothetical protein
LWDSLLALHAEYHFPVFGDAHATHPWDSLHALHVKCHFSVFHYPHATNPAQIHCLHCTPSVAFAILAMRMQRILRGFVACIARGHSVFCFLPTACNEFCVHAAEALGMLGPAARAAVPRLRQLAEDEENEIAEAATRALERIERK